MNIYPSLIGKADKEAGTAPARHGCRASPTTELAPQSRSFLPKNCQITTRIFNWDVDKALHKSCIHVSSHIRPTSLNLYKFSNF